MKENEVSDVYHVPGLQVFMCVCVSAHSHAHYPSLTVILQ